jgi:hypothetical protein
MEAMEGTMDRGGRRSEAVPAGIVGRSACTCKVPSCGCKFSTGIENKYCASCETAGIRPIDPSEGVRWVTHFCVR